MTVKKIVPLCLALSALLTTLVAEAQTTPPKRDSVLLSERIDDNYRLRRYRVGERTEHSYQLHYRISDAAVQPALEDNAAELDSLRTLATRLQDTLNRLTTLHIRGYASPDGPAALNESLAMRRATAMKSYLAQRVGLDAGSAVLDGQIASWDAVRAAVAASSMPQREAVLAILDSDATPMEKQAALKSHPEAWRYMALHILPPLRRVEVTVTLDCGRIVESRTPLAPPAPKPAPKPKPTPASVAKPTDSPCRTDPDCAELLETETLGIIVAMPGTEVDF